MLIGRILIFSKLNRNIKTSILIAIDAVLIAFSFIGAMFFRLESTAFLRKQEFWGALFVLLLIVLSAFYFFGLYRTLVRFVTGKILSTIGSIILIAVFLLYIIIFAINLGIPRSVPLIFGILLFFFVGAIRFSIRYILRAPIINHKIPVIIYGAGDSGILLLNSLFHGRDYHPVALVDDDPNLKNYSVGGLKVHSPDQLPLLIGNTGSRVILLAISNIRRARRREIISVLEDLNVEIKIIPELSDIISGKAKVSELRSVMAEDLLGRDPVAPDPDLLSKNIMQRVVMVSGAGGSIGSELCRQILYQRPAMLVLFEVSEFALYTIETELTMIAKRLHLPARVVPVLGSIQNRPHLEAVIKAFGVQTIYHAAAYKHVPLVEDNVIEGIRNNVFGTLAITLAAEKLGVENFILISTDKAVRPTNIMGATKRIAELICQAYARESSSTVFSIVRFGNVLGSSGSVIPKFRAQIENGGPITVTHKEVTRYFMTIREASQLVIQAGAMGINGGVFVLDMGEPVKILDLAIGMVKLHGLTPYIVDHPDQVIPENGDIPIYFTGMRKGEKLYEELLIGNNPSPTFHARIMTAYEISLDKNELSVVLERLLNACESRNIRSIISILHELPIDYTAEKQDISG